MPADTDYSFLLPPSDPNAGKFTRKNRVDLYRTLLGSMIRIVLSAMIWGILWIPSILIFMALGVVVSLKIPVFSIIFIGLLENFSAIFICCWIFYQIRKVWKRANRDWRFSIVIWRNFLLAPLGIFLLVYIPFTIHHILTVPVKELSGYSGYAFCEYFTNKMEGGWREFQGKKYKLQMCGSAIYEPAYRVNAVGHKIRLAVFDESGDLRALGYFTTEHENYFPIEISENSIEYGDWADSDNDRIIKMPPSKLEWIRARLPFIKYDFLDSLENFRQYIKLN
jgi:hypothetical protein